MALGPGGRSDVLVFAVEKIDVRNGHVRVVAVNPGHSMEIRIEGDGGAFDTGEGRMTAIVSLDSRPATKAPPTRWTVLFVAGRKLLKTVSSLSAELAPHLPAVSKAVFQRMKQVGFNGLTVAGYTLMVWELDASVTKGGFESYFRSAASDWVAATLQVLQTIRARRGVVHLRDALTVFGKAGPPPDRSARERQVQQLSEAAKTHLRGRDKWWGSTTRSPSCGWSSSWRATASSPRQPLNEVVLECYNRSRVWAEPAQDCSGCRGARRIERAARRLRGGVDREGGEGIRVRRSRSSSRRRAWASCSGARPASRTGGRIPTSCIVSTLRRRCMKQESSSTCSSAATTGLAITTSRR